MTLRFPPHPDGSRATRRLEDLTQQARQTLAELETLLDDDGLGHGPQDEPEFLRYRRMMLECEESDAPG